MQTHDPSDGVGAPSSATVPQSSKPLLPRPSLQIPIIVGTRPEAIKLVPIILAMRASEDFHPIVVSTGQHHRMVEEIFALAGIRSDVTLWAGGRRELNERVSSVMSRFEDFILEWYGDPPERVTPEAVLSGRFPACVLVHGDTSSALAAALSSFHLHIPVLHIEAGLRVGGSNLTPFPEELNRELISRIAGLHCAPTSRNLENLVREGVSVDRIYVTGNTGIDALHWVTGLQAPFGDPELEAFCAGDHRVVLVTAHRRESWESGLTRIAEGISRLAAAHPDVRFVVPLHPNPLVRERFGDPLKSVPNVLLTEPLPYAPFASLMNRSSFVITDSGGIQEEAPALGKPVLVIREQTERQEGVDAGTLRIVGTDPDVIVSEGHRLLTDPVAYEEMQNAENPYGDGRASKRLLAALDYLLRGGAAPAPFGCSFNRFEVLHVAGFDRTDETLDTVLARMVEGQRIGDASNQPRRWTS